MLRRSNMLRLMMACTFAVTITSSPVHAQPDAAAELDALIGPTQEVASGMTLARRQIGESDLIAAVATLERVLLAHPDATEARLLYASLLCRLDDPAGARVEIRLLRGEGVPESAWAEVTNACGAIARESGQ